MMHCPFTTQEKKADLFGRLMSLDFEHYFLCAYVLFSSLVARVVSPSSLFSALLVTPNLFLIPYILGRNILRMLSNNWLKKVMASRFLFSFVVGSIFLHGFFVLMEFFGFRIEFLFVNSIIFIVILLGCLLDVRFILRKDSNWNQFKWLRKADLNLLFGISLAVLIGVLAFYISKLTLPFPLTSFDSGVVHETINPVTRLLNVGVLDVFKARSLPIILQALVCSMSGISVLHLSWAAPLCTSLFFALTVFSLAYAVSKSQAVAVSAALFAVFLSTGSGFFFDSVYFIFRYSTIAQAIFPLALQQVYFHFVNPNFKMKTTKPLVLLFTGSAIMICICYIFEFLKPAFLTSLFIQNEFFNPFIFYPFLCIMFAYSFKVINENCESTAELIIFLSLFTVFNLALDILRPVINIMILYFFLLTLITCQAIKKTDLLKIVYALSKKKRVINLRLLSSNAANALRVFSLIMILWIVLCLSGAVNFSDASFVSQWVIRDTLFKSQQFISSNSLWVLTTYLVLCSFLLCFGKKGEFVFSFLSLVNVCMYLLPIAELNHIIHYTAPVFMGLVIALGLFKIVNWLARFKTVKNVLNSEF